jgi:hypothetical protein
MKIFNKNGDVILETNEQSLRDADLRDADLRDADLKGADLKDAYLTGADLKDAYLRDADLRDADLKGAYLRDADLRGADLRGAYLTSAYLRDADLRGAKNIIQWQAPVGIKRICYSVKHNDCVMHKLGCFWGNTDEAVAAIREKYGKDSLYKEFLLMQVKALESEK